MCVWVGAILRHVALTSAFGVDHPLGNPLPVKVRHLVHVDKILHEHGPTRAHRLDGRLAVDGVAMAGGENLGGLNGGGEQCREEEREREQTSSTNRLPAQQCDFPLNARARTRYYM